MKKKTLLDLTADKNPHISRKEIFAHIMCGKVKVDGETIRDPKRKVGIDKEPETLLRRYVSRGGFKLEQVLKLWNIETEGKGYLDAGCSTGGFTDCLLQSGASFVHAVDVGYNQLDYSLRVDSRVIVHEKTNIMHIDRLDPLPYAAVADLSFRSITDAAARVLTLVSEGMLIALVKPQFEVIDPDDDFDGIVRGADQVFAVADRVLRALWEEGSYVEKTALSPVKGRKGNQELLFLIRNREIYSYEKVSSELKENIDKFFN